MTIDVPIQLQPGPHVPGHRIYHDDQQSLLLIDRCVQHFTPTEYRLLLLLLSQADKAVPYARLIELLPQMHRLRTMPARIKLQRLISGLRPKIWSFGLDVVCLHGLGYLLVSSPPESGEAT